MGFCYGEALMQLVGLRLLWPLLALATVSCAPGAPVARVDLPAPQRATGGHSQQTLVIVARGEPPSFAARPIVPFSGSIGHTTRLFNAQLDFLDERETPHPYLAEALPQLNTDTWQVFPDGTMETRYRLRSNLVWQDGASLSAEDFAFAYRVFVVPEFGAASSAPIGSMAEVRAPDPATVVIRWGRLDPDAGVMDLKFQALPRHLLEQAFQNLDHQAFASLPFWTQEYVGLGPYRVERWDPGSAIEAVAFAGHALGRPTIDRIRVIFISDANTALATMLSGEAHYISESVIWYEEGATLEQEWSARNGGTVLYSPVVFRITLIQNRAEAADPARLRDVRVRRALAHGIDRDAAFESSTGGKGVLMYSLTPPTKPFYPELDRVIAKYPYDPARTAQLLGDAGLVRGTGGFFAGPAGESFRVEVATDGGATNERENSIFVDSLRRAGVDASSKVVPVAQLRDTQARALLPGLSTGGMPQNRLDQFTSGNIPRPDNRWQGNNRGAWSSPEYDRLWQQYSTTISPAERVPLIAQLEKLFSEDVGAIPHFYSVVATGHVAALAGPIAPMTPDAGRGILNVHRWEWRSRRGA
jgi:peptide/nickel transport system substrate-binding protein